MPGIRILTAVLALLGGCGTDERSTVSPERNQLQSKDARPARERDAEVARIDSELGYGDLSGRFVFDGDPPARRILIERDDPTARDPQECAQETLYDESLIVDPATRGVANVFVYLHKTPRIHPDLAESGNADVSVKYEHCRFVPHAIILRTDQKVRIQEHGAILHSTHTFPTVPDNESFSTPVLPADRDGVVTRRFFAPEKFPVRVKCDIHAWESAFWLPLDHPYSALSDAQGRFHIKKLPAGEHGIVVWHERSGPIERNLRVRIEPDKTTELGIRKFEPAKFVRE